MHRSNLTRCLALLCTLVLLLVGCAKGSQSTATEDPVHPTLDPKGEPIELTFLHMYQWVDRDALDEVIRSFEDKYPHVTVRVRAQETPTTQSGKLRTELFDGVDIFWAAPSAIRLMDEAGLLRDLSQARLPEWDPLTADWIDGTSYWQGKRVFIPFALEPVQMTVFGRAFDAAGLPKPGADWTYADLETLALQLKAADQELHLTVFGLMEPAMHAYGGGLYDYASGRWSLDTPQNREVLSLLGRMVQEGTVTIDSPHVQFKEESGPALSVIGSVGTQGYANLPMPKGPFQRGSRISSVGAMLMNNSAHPEAALAFLEELLSEAGQTAFARKGVRPVTNLASAMSVWAETVGQEAADGIEESFAGAFLESGRPVQNVSIYAQLNRFFEGHATLDELLPDLERRLNDDQ